MWDCGVGVSLKAVEYKLNCINEVGIFKKGGTKMMSLPFSTCIYIYIYRNSRVRVILIFVRCVFGGGGGG